MLNVTAFQMVRNLFFLIAAYKEDVPLWILPETWKSVFKHATCLPSSPQSDQRDKASPFFLHLPFGLACSHLSWPLKQLGITRTACLASCRLRVFTVLLLLPACLLLSGKEANCVLMPRWIQPEDRCFRTQWHYLFYQFLFHQPLQRLLGLPHTAANLF